MKNSKTYSNNAHWKVYFNNGLKNIKEFGMTSFYLLPTIEYYRDTFLDEEGDCSFNIYISWLFWGVTISRYWGSVYDNKYMK